MGMKLAQDIANGAGRFLELGGCIETELGHGVDDSSLHRFETVADVRQGTIENDVHGVIEIGLLGES